MEGDIRSGTISVPYRETCWMEAMEVWPATIITVIKKMLP